MKDSFCSTLYNDESRVQTQHLQGCWNANDSLYSVAVQRPCDIETVAALHGSDSRLHDSSRAQHWHSGVYRREVTIALQPCLQTGNTHRVNSETSTHRIRTKTHCHTDWEMFHKAGDTQEVHVALVLWVGQPLHVIKQELLPRTAPWLPRLCAPCCQHTVFSVRGV